MPNTSATGGYLSPSSINGDLNDSALADFLQTVVVGITGLDGSFVRPRWQVEPPNKPALGTNWVGLGVHSRKPDGFPYERVGRLYRQEILGILCSFYGPNSEANAELLSLGFQVDQNLEAMKLQGFGLIEVDDPLSVPELVHERYVYRVDLGFRLRRVQIYDYSVLTLSGAQVDVKNEQLPDQTFVVNYQSVVNRPAFAFGVQAEFLAGWGTGNWD